MQELPRLSSAELLAQFGNSERALRRYRMLVALLREGRSPGEVAETFGVSRESIRRLRHAYDQQGMAAIRDQQRQTGHLSRSSPLTIAIRQELSIAPDSAPALLWKRVQARLAEEGLSAPRSTFYRLLPAIRSHVAPPDTRVSTALLRDALGMVAEDPPISLGRSELAEMLLADTPDTLERGRTLQQALFRAIERLRPGDAVPIHTDPRWRSYLIIAGEYRAGEKRAGLQRALALSASTYSRAKRDALDRLMVLLPSVLSALPPPRPDVTLVAPPEPPATCLYEPELEQYMLLLRKQGFALLWGPAGMNKRDLAATLAARLQQRGQKLAWHSVRPPESDATPATSLLHSLAVALSLRGRSELWEALRSRDYPHSRLLDMLGASLQGSHLTLIIANAHWLTDAPSRAIIDVLAAAGVRRDLRLVVVAREVPIWADARGWPALPFPHDTAGRERFAALLGSTETPSPLSIALLAIREHLAELTTAISPELLASLSAEEQTMLRQMLQPLIGRCEQLGLLMPEGARALGQ